MKIALPYIALVACFTIPLFLPERHDAALVQALKDQIQENQRLRMFNVRRERRLKWMREPEKLNMDAVATASHVEGTPPFFSCRVALL